MPREREGEISDQLMLHKHTEPVKLMLELFAIRRERHRDRLESEENPEIRGRAKECKDILSFLC